MDRSCSQNGRRILTGKLTGKRPFSMPRRTWEDSIRMDLREIDITMRNWVDSTQDRNYQRVHVNAALNLWVHKPWNQLYILGNL